MAASGSAINYEPESPPSGMNVTNSTFTGNRANASNGFEAALNDEPVFPFDTSSLTQVTLAGNHGGGLFNNGLGTLTVANSIVSGNTDPSGSNCLGNQPVSVGHNIELGTSCGFDINANPLLLPLAHNGGPTRTMALQAGSPAIDAAAPAYCPATDQRGAPRPDDPGTACDIGAYESGPPS